ncbi:FAD dependent oxidoreductase [Suillus paluster]|uniref:FAD dependent oxidoreductase n=1 Tax=Suillus paluster TaxID=48578 RepID=UPI001B87C3AE|nr:FAD dependent oxidoreductase [Suillus paluster]KAG1748461.1 FAD dependent oxidoreductase [Suillus paluster]
MSLTETCKEIAASLSSAHQSSSSQIAKCSFEPGTFLDVGIAVICFCTLQILGKTRTPFAAKGGGHASNPGLVWDDVYAALEPYGVNVVGIRVPGVGVACFTLGGGYSWLSNQYGLTIDTMQSFELAIPNDTVLNVTAASDPEFEAHQNYGIVTRFTLKTFSQSQVWGGIIIYSAKVSDLVSQVAANFAANITDPKAQIITTYNHILGVVSGVLNFIFYDGPSPPGGIFGHPSPLIAYDVEPFIPSIYSHSTTPSAYPPSRDRGLLLLDIYFAWTSLTSDGIMQQAVRDSAAHLRQLAITEGQDIADAASYGNYAIFDTLLSNIYGENVPRLQAIKTAVDPTNVMGLAGGFKF